jgi:hypothetical protein
VIPRPLGRPLGRAAVLGLVVGAATTGRAWAYDFTIDVQTIGQGYQVRGYAPSGGSELLSRRRLTQILNLGVFNIEPDAWHADDPDPTARNVVYVDASLRFDTDFGAYMLARPTGVDSIHELQQSQVDVLYAFLGGRRMGGAVDFQLGRQLHFDLVDFYAFDGGDALVRVRPWFGVEAFGGTEVRGELPLSSPMYELDGTSAGSRDPATRPDQDAQLRPLAGAALVLAPDGGLPVTARLAYRRMWAATADRAPGEPDTGVDDEKLAATATAELRRRVFLTAGVRYNLLLAMFDDEQVALRVRATERQWVGVEMAYLAPTFDGDSIWNVFSSGAYRDVRGSYELGLPAGLKAYLRGFGRRFDDGGDTALPGDTAPGARWAGGGSAGLTWRGAHGVVRGDGYFDGGAGGRKTGVDLSARCQLRRRPVELEGRLTGWQWRSDQQSATDTGFVVGAQAGARAQLGPGVRLHLLVEDNVGTFYTSQYRGLAVLEISASP